MKRLKFSDLKSSDSEHVLHHLIPEKYIWKGGLSFHKPGMRTHDYAEERHDYYEVFAVMQGRGWIEIDGIREPIHAGEVLIIEPGDEHHVVGDPAHPIVNLWFDLGSEPHENQRGVSGLPVK
jgi:quercetin dioxygenase-like cupin family protein